MVAADEGVVGKESISVNKNKLVIKVSLLFVISSITSSALVAFILGYHFTIFRPSQISVSHHEDAEKVDVRGDSAALGESFLSPLLSKGKDLPHTIYKSRH